MQAAVYFLGAVGLVAFGLLPLRIWQRAHWAFFDIPEGNVRRFARMLVSVVALLATVVYADIAQRIFNCLTESYCGPGVASGWAYLAFLGAVFIGFEALMATTKWVVRHAV
jgi:hypothetical protein